MPEASSMSMTPSRLVSPAAAKATRRLPSSPTAMPTPRPLVAAASRETIPDVPDQEPPAQPADRRSRTVARSYPPAGIRRPPAPTSMRPPAATERLATSIGAVPASSLSRAAAATRSPPAPSPSALATASSPASTTVPPSKPAAEGSRRPPTPRCTSRAGPEMPPSTVAVPAVLITSSLPETPVTVLSNRMSPPAVDVATREPVASVTLPA